MTKSPKQVSNAEEATAFLEFYYVEIKSLAIQFLTVVAGVLALTVTFSEKIVTNSDADTALKVLMSITWVCCLLAFVAGGRAIHLIYNAGAVAKHAALHDVPGNYWDRTHHTYRHMIFAGGMFVVALGALVLAGICRFSVP